MVTLLGRASRPGRACLRAAVGSYLFHWLMRFPSVAVAAPAFGLARLLFDLTLARLAAGSPCGLMGAPAAAGQRAGSPWCEGRRPGTRHRLRAACRGRSGRWFQAA